MNTIVLESERDIPKIRNALVGKKPAKVKVADAIGILVTEEEFANWQATLNHGHKIPNAETLVAFQEIEDMKQGKIPLQTIKAKDMIKWLDEEDEEEV
ncbi:MAG: hypothetical protein FWB72_06230 [Firmicutes bacterium]|nr:hypothetical protein [Bacillota bacterium]